MEVALPQVRPPQPREDQSPGQAEAENSSSTRAPSRTLERAMTSRNIPENQSSTQLDAEQATLSQIQRYQLRKNRAPRYRCGTCGSRDCRCVNLVMRETLDYRLARRVKVLACELVTTRASGHYLPQHAILAVRPRRQNCSPISTSCCDDNRKENVRKHRTRSGTSTRNHTENDAQHFTRQLS